MTPADPYFELLREAAGQVYGCIGDRAAAFLPDGRAFLLEARAEGVLLVPAQSDDDVALWLLPTGGEA